MSSNKCIVYIGDFDLRNENVQSFLVRNNGKIFTSLGYKIYFVGINSKVGKTSDLCRLPPVELDSKMYYLELPNTLNFNGLFRIKYICSEIINYLENLSIENDIKYLISYQSPTYSFAIKIIALWCKKNNVKYIVNSADLPIFRNQRIIRRLVMKINWMCLHFYNKKYADGLIAVSNYLESYYKKSIDKTVVIPPLFDTYKFNFYRSKRNNIVEFIYAGIPFKVNGYKVSPRYMKDRLDKIIDIFDELKKKDMKYILRIIGITRDEYLIGVPRHDSLLKSNLNIEFLGRKNHTDTINLVSKSDFSINFRDVNKMTLAGFSTKIVESISLGTPVVINSISDTFNYLNEGTTGFKLSGDFKIDCEIVAFLCNMPKDKREILKFNTYDKRVFEISNYQEKMFNFLETL